MAAGKMGWKDEEFWFSVPSYFFAAYAGWIEQESDRANVGFAQARLIAFYTISPHLEKGSTVEMADIWPLPWDQDKEPQFPEISPEEMAAFEAATERFRKNHLDNGISGGN